MVEGIGVMGVIAVLVGLVAPSIIQRVDRATWTKETRDLRAFADCYTQYILTNKTIPGTSTWSIVVAQQMSLPLSGITSNMRGNARAFLVDTNLSIAGGGLAYPQTMNGATKPVSARVMFVSSLSRALPVVTGVPKSSEFNAIWDTAEGAKPSTWTNWAGSGDDLLIQRLNLEPLFHQLILVDRDPANQARFSIDSGTNVMAITNASSAIWNKYYLDGTIVSVHDTNGVVLRRHRLKRSLSFVFEAGAWGDDQIPTRPAYSGTGAEFVNHAIGFLSSSNNPYAAKGTTTTGALISLYTFMFDYALWANQCPHFSWHGQSGSNPVGVPEYDLLDFQGANNGNIDTFTQNLIQVP